MTTAIGAQRRERAGMRKRSRPDAWRILGWVAALALVAFAVTFAVSPGDDSASRVAPGAGVAHDATFGAAHDRGHDAPALHDLRAQPASRSRASMFAVLAVGVVVAALARRELHTGARAVAGARRWPGLRPGRGPPFARIA
jgi:hypothetical protein